MPTLLIIAVLLPLAGGLALFGLPGLNYRQARWVALGTALATLLLSLVLAAAFRVDEARPQFAATSAEAAKSAGPASAYGWGWIDVGHGPGIRFALGLDGVGLSLFVLTTLLMITSIFASWESIKERAPAHYALMLLLETGLLGLFASLDVVLFYIFFEFTLIPLFFLIGLYGGPERQRASVTFFLYTLAGSLLTLLGVIALVVVHYQNTGVLTFSIPGLTQGLRTMNWPAWAQAATTWTSPQALIFLLLFAGFAIKVPLFPFHTWLPLAHVEAPTAGSILLAGVLLKVGGYGFLRFNLGMTPVGAHYWMPLLATLSVIGIIYGALTALAQSDVKRLVAYSSVSHMGFITLGLFSLSNVGLDGAVIQMINHGLTTGALFACVGILYERYHTREMGEMGGLWDRLPLLAFFLILASLGSAAVPGLNGFVGEFPILLGMFGRAPVYAVLATIGMVLGAYYLLLMLQRVLFGPLREPDGHGHHDAHGPAHAHDHPPVRPVGWHEIAGLTPLMVLIVAIGVYPKPIFDRIGPPLREIAKGFPAEKADARPDPDPATADDNDHARPREAGTLAALRQTQPQDSAR
jgi:NADH-quinone oxidoreductase subunit M